MAFKYFKKEYHSEYSGGSYGIGWLDTEQTYNDEGQEYLAKMYFVERDKDMFKISIGDDFIDKEELDNLQEISYEEHLRWVKFFSLIDAKASAMIDGRTVSILPEV